MKGETGVMANIADLLANAAARWPDSVALVDTTAGSAFTWSQLDSAVNGQACALAGQGVGPGDRVVLRLPTSADYAIALFAVTRLGAIAVPISPLAPPPELTTVLEHSGARLVLSRDSAEGR